MDLLNKDYEHISTVLLHNEDVGEKRITFFISLSTLVAAGTVSLATAEDAISHTGLITFSAFFVLLFLGIILLMRMIKRNRMTDRLKAELDDIRQRRKDCLGHHPGLHGYSVLSHMKPAPLRFGKIKKSGNQKFEPRKIGRLTHVVAVINSAFFSAMIALVWQIRINPELHKPLILFLVMGFSFVLVFVVQGWLVHHQGKFNKANAVAHRPTHAGGLVFRKWKEEYQVLLVTAKSDSSVWVLPKGHIFKNEGHAECAVREVWEESGRISYPVSPIATVAAGDSKKYQK